MYSSVFQRLIHREAFRIKARCLFLKDLLPQTAITDNTVTPAWINNRRTNIQTALKKHLLTQQPEKSTHTPNVQTCKRSFSIKLYQNDNLSLFMHFFFLFSFFSSFEEGPLLLAAFFLVVFFLSSESSCQPLTKIIRAELTIGVYNMAVFGSIRSTWNSVNTTSFCAHMRVCKRQGVSVSSGWFSCH